MPALMRRDLPLFCITSVRFPATAQSYVLNQFNKT
jgi:hypothetical protein